MKNCWFFGGEEYLSDAKLPYSLGSAINAFSLLEPYLNHRLGAKIKSMYSGTYWNVWENRDLDPGLYTTVDEGKSATEYFFKRGSEEGTVLMKFLPSSTDKFEPGYYMGR